MKKIFRTTYLALLLIAGLSCNNDPMPDAPKGKYPILFRCSDETRAVATVESMKGDGNGFDVYAYIVGSTGATDSFYRNVKWDGSAWSYTNTEYWIPGATYWFKAVYPHGIATVDNDDSNQAVTITGYDISNQDDILVAKTEGLKATPEDQAPTTGSVVSLQFKHLLANVTIKIKTEIDGVTINSITISDIADYGTYEESQWSSSNKTSITITVEPKIELSKGEEYVDITNGGILVIPAEANGVTLSISTSSKNYDNIKIPAINWEIDKKYTYTIVIQQSDIILNEPNVAKWDSDSATGSVIIK